MEGVGFSNRLPPFYSDMDFCLHETYNNAIDNSDLI